MCGIVGVVGNKNARDILMQGLENLNIAAMIALGYRYQSKSKCKTYQVWVELPTYAKKSAWT
jgi:hypothetical protein